MPGTDALQPCTWFLVSTLSSFVSCCNAVTKKKTLKYLLMQYLISIFHMFHIENLFETDPSVMTESARCVSFVLVRLQGRLKVTAMIQLDLQSNKTWARWWSKVVSEVLRLLSTPALLCVLAVQEIGPHSTLQNEAQWKSSECHHSNTLSLFCFHRNTTLYIEA